MDEAAEEFLKRTVCPTRREPPRLAVPLTGIERQTVRTQRGAVAAWRAGEGPAVLLVHGWEDDNSLWTEMLETLIARSFPVVVFDLPAHGFSEGDAGMGFEGVDALHAVAGDLGPIDSLVGHSMGATLAGVALWEGLGVARCVLIAPPLGLGNRWLRVAERKGVPEETALQAQAMYEATFGERRAAFVLREVLPTLDTELIFVHSVDDERMPFADTEAVSARCRNARLLRVAGCGHRRTARDRIAITAMIDFLERRD